MYNRIMHFFFKMYQGNLARISYILVTVLHIKSYTDLSVYNFVFTAI